MGQIKSEMKKESKCVEFKSYWDWWMFDRKGMEKKPGQHIYSHVSADSLDFAVIINHTIGSACHHTMSLLIIFITQINF